MPLSDHEQRILAELEESLVRQDPEFAERVRSETVYRHAGRYCKWAAVTFVLGVVILVAFYSDSVIAGFVGVVIMFASAVWFERNLRRMGRAGWHDLTRAKDGEQSKSARRVERDRRRRDRGPRLVPLPLPPARGLSTPRAARGPSEADPAVDRRAGTGCALTRLPL